MSSGGTPPSLLLGGPKKLGLKSISSFPQNVEMHSSIGFFGHLARTHALQFRQQPPPPPCRGAP